MNLGVPELLIILVIVVLLFGASRISGVARETVNKLLLSLGEACADYMDGAFQNLDTSSARFLPPPNTKMPDPPTACRSMLLPSVAQVPIGPCVLAFTVPSSASMPISTIRPVSGLPELE